MTINPTGPKIIRGALYIWDICPVCGGYGTGDPWYWGDIEMAAYPCPRCHGIGECYVIDEDYQAGEEERNEQLR